jgi:transketolase
VSLPSWNLFSRQEPEYVEQVLPRAVSARVSAEAGSTLAWPRWIGNDGEAVGLDRFGASAPSATLFRELGFTAATVVAEARRVLERVTPRS